MHPLVVRAVLGSPPASKGEVVARYLSLFGELETRLKDQKARAAGAACRCPSRNGSRCVRHCLARTVRWRSRWKSRGRFWIRASGGSSIG